MGIVTIRPGEKQPLARVGEGKDGWRWAVWGNRSGLCQPLRVGLARGAVGAQLPKRPLDPTSMTPGQFYHTLAKNGDWLGRKLDGHPRGWTTLWRGW